MAVLVLLAFLSTPCKPMKILPDLKLRQGAKRMHAAPFNPNGSNPQVAISSALKATCIAG